MSPQGHCKLGAGSRQRGAVWGQARKGLGGSVPVEPSGLPVSTPLLSRRSPHARLGKGGGWGGVPDPGAPAESSFTSWIPGRLPGPVGRPRTGVCSSCCSAALPVRWRAPCTLAGASGAVRTCVCVCGGGRAAGKRAPRPHGTVGEAGSHTGGQGYLGESKQQLRPRPASALTLCVSRSESV